MIKSSTTLINVSGCAFINGTIDVSSSVSLRQELIHSASKCLTLGPGFKVIYPRSDCSVDTASGLSSLVLICSSG